MKRTVRTLLASAVAGSMMALTVGPASAVPFSDGSFEIPDISPNAFVTLFPGNFFGPWMVQSGSVNFLNSPTFVASDGDQSANLSGTSPNPPAAPTAGAVVQLIDTVGGTQYTLQYDWTSKCAGSDVRVTVDGVVVDTATNPSAAYPTYSTRTVPVQPLSNSTTLRFTTTTTGPPGSSGQICGTIIDNVRLTQNVTPVVGAAPASQCSGPTGHRVQFRKVDFDVTSFSLADAAYKRPVTDPAVLAQASHNGVPYINYADVPSPAVFPGRPAFDVGVPPLTLVAGAPPGFASGASDINYVMRSTGYFSVPTSGAWTFITASDDGARLILGTPGVFIQETAFGTVSTTVNLAAGCYHYALEWYQHQGPANVVFLAAGPGQAGSQPVGDTPANGGTSALTVYQGTDSPSTCRISAIRRAPNSLSGTQDEMDITVIDLDGIGGIYNVQATNAMVLPEPFEWIPGLSGPLIVRAIKVTQGQPAAFSFTVSDFNGNEKICT